MRGQNFVVQYTRADEAGGFAVESPREMLLVLPDCGAEIAAEGEPPVTADANSSCILPAGRYAVALLSAGACAVLAPARPDVPADRVRNQASYLPPDPRVLASSPRRRRRADRGGVRVFDMSQVQAPTDRPRLKLLQTDAMSINWASYHGPRDRAKLTPHSHADFEQGSLLLRGRFVQHLRQPWGPDAGLWLDDEHLAAPSPSLAVFPPELVHTTEGVGDESHLLVDIFCPVREDFLARGWIFNADDYEPL